MIKEIKPLWSHIGTAIEEIWNLEEQKDIKKVEEKNKEAEKKDNRKAR